jgi:DNA-directed RNA polymerase
MSETRERTTTRLDRRSFLWTAKNTPRPFIQTPVGRILGGQLVEHLGDFFAGKLDEQPAKPPKFMRPLIKKLNDPHFLALAALAPLLDGIFRGWDRENPSAGGLLKKAVGTLLSRRLRSSKIIPKPFSGEERVRAGDWLLDQVLRREFFSFEDKIYPCISEKYKPHVEELREWLIAANPVFAPMLKPPPPWTGSRKTYADGFEAKFADDWRPETERRIKAAFLNGDFEHARGVNRLAQVPLKIVDPVMVDLVEQFGPDVMGNDGKQREADKVTVDADVADARWCLNHGTFWLDYNCDWRGRVYPLQHLNFERGDHVRAMFRFAHGLPINGNTYWLEINVANCHGETDKLARVKRFEWVKDHRDDIRRIASDPFGTFDKGVLDNRGWRSAEKPFQFVAACREITAAWDNPKNFVTHLPIGFDGSANGLQHLTLLIEDRETARKVNLLKDDDDDTPKDVYPAVINRAIALIEDDDCDHAKLWRERLERLTPKQRRKLLKTPAMTFNYSVTEKGAARQIEDAWAEINQRPKPKARWHNGKLKRGPPPKRFRYLAQKLLEACALELPRERSVMIYISLLAEYSLGQGKFLTWTSPSGMPCENRYQKSKYKVVQCLRGSVRVAQHKIADGVSDRARKKKVLQSAAANFTHSLDAAHLIKTVNAAASEGIIDILTVHDCFYCLAPQAERLQKIIMEQLSAMYKNNDPLADLRNQNVSVDEPWILPVPPKGTLKPWPEDPRCLVMDRMQLDDLKKATNAFG